MHTSFITRLTSFNSCFQARLLFSEYDTDGTGQITVNDLGKNLLERTEADLGTQGVYHIEEDREVQQLLVW